MASNIFKVEMIISAVVEFSGHVQIPPTVDITDQDDPFVLALRVKIREANEALRTKLAAGPPPDLGFM